MVFHVFFFSEIAAGGCFGNTDTPGSAAQTINPAMYERRGGEDEMFRTILGYIVILVPTEQ